MKNKKKTLKNTIIFFIEREKYKELTLKIVPVEIGVCVLVEKNIIKLDKYRSGFNWILQKPIKPNIKRNRIINKNTKYN